MKELAQGSELPDFDKGVIVGCQLRGLPSRTVITKLNLLQSRIPFVLSKFNVEGHSKNAKCSGRPKIVTNRDRRILKR